MKDYSFDNMEAFISINTEISSDPSTIWKYLTDIKLMAEWMGEPEMGLEIDTNWIKGNSITIRGFHHEIFENKGIVLCNQQNILLSYSHLSSSSQLRDEPQNHAVLTFKLTPKNNHTLLTLRIENFATETIKKHLQFYWRTTVITLKTKIEGDFSKA